MDLFRPLRHLPDLREPLFELLLLVGVVEALRGGQARLLPVLGVAAVEAHDRECVVRDRGDRRHARRKTLRLIDGDIREAVVLEEGERLGPIALAHPRRVAELHRQAVVGQELARVKYFVLVRSRDGEPFRVLEQDRAELPRLAERLEPDPVPREELLARVLWKVLRINATLRGRLLWQR